MADIGEYTVQDLFGDQDPVTLGASTEAMTCLQCGSLINYQALSTHVTYHNDVRNLVALLARVVNNAPQLTAEVPITRATR